MPKVHELITPETWAHGSPARGPNGEQCQFCALEWLEKVYSRWTGTIYMDSVIVLKKTIGITKLALWNDAPERTFEEVLDAFRKADL